MDAASPASALIWLFDHCRFDEGRLELWVAEQLVELERKPLEVLRHLLRHAGEVVTKDELEAAVWPGRVLSETVLTKAVSRIREAVRDSEQRIIKTVHGYGYRLVAAVTVAAAGPGAGPVPVLGLKDGDQPPLRPHWQLEEHLNSGGFGEVWRVRQVKTGESRVYKFALNGDALAGLKREITLFRLLRTQLGDQAPIAEIRDWNLEEAPYFLEMSDYPLGNLAFWLAQRGGFAVLDGPARLRLFLAIADAVAQVHRVGVLHKDIKPSNILISELGDGPRPLLADFGGGGVVAEDLIANAGITRLGFTQALDPSAVGTPLYAAPELLEGQPQTTRSDVYALGVLLYQLMIGDLRKPLASGWERRIDDELLREDIDAAVQGAPERRLASAQELVDRLSRLDARRLARAGARAEAQRREESERALERLRLRRGWMLATIAALLLGLGLAWVQFIKADRERQRAEAAATTALATGRFMFEGLLSALDADQQPKAGEVSVKDLLDNAARSAERRLGDDPEIAFYVHTALSSAFNQMDNGVRDARQQEVLAHQALSKLADRNPRRAVELIPPNGLWVVRPEDKELFELLLETARDQFGADHPSIQGLLGALSDAEFRYGSLQAAQRRATEAQLIAEGRDDAENVEDNIAFRIRLAREDANFQLAESLLPASAQWVARRQPAPPVSLAYLDMDRGITSLLRGHPQQASTDLEKGFRQLAELQGPATWYYRYPLAYMAMLRADQGRNREARDYLREWVEILQRVSPDEVDMPMEALVVAETAWRLGDAVIAEQLLQRLLASPAPGRTRCAANHGLMLLASLALEAHRPEQARRWLSQINDQHWYDYRPGHPREAQRLEIEGLLLASGNAPEAAQGKLREAHRLYAATYAPDHWRLQRIRRLLAGMS